MNRNYIIAVPDADGWPHVAAVNPTPMRGLGVNDQCACSVKNSGCAAGLAKEESAARAADQQPVPSAARCLVHSATPVALMN